MDFGVIPSIGHAMDEQELRGLFTDIRYIMEDSNVTALVWEQLEAMYDDPDRQLSNDNPL